MAKGLVALDRKGRGAVKALKRQKNCFEKERSKTKKRMKKEELEKGNCGTPT